MCAVSVVPPFTLARTLRTRLFARVVLGSPAPLAAQRLFHRHRWTKRPELSVLMRRPESRTVSRTFLDVARQRIDMRYEAR